MQNSNGGPWYEFVDTLSGTLVSGDVYVIANASADASILAEADLIGSGICFFNDTATTEIYTLHIVGSVRCV